MRSRDDILDPTRLSNRLLLSKDKLLKKKNSEIESRLFGKTQYYVIAIGKRPSVSQSGGMKVRAYIYCDGYICFYSTQGKAYNKIEYIKYIDFVKQAVETKRYQWASFWINKGQIITIDRTNSIHVDNELVLLFGNSTALLNNVSELSLKLYYDFLRNFKEGNQEKLDSLEVSYNKGLLKEKVEKTVRSSQDRELKDIDGEIIIRTNIEGYSYIISYIKETLASDKKNKFEKVNAFFSRIFFLEMHGYIGNEEE